MFFETNDPPDADALKKPWVFKKDIPGPKIFRKKLLDQQVRDALAGAVEQFLPYLARDLAAMKAVDRWKTISALMPYFIAKQPEMESEEEKEVTVRFIMNKIDDDANDTDETSD